jgi:hypothetical protein
MSNLDPWINQCKNDLLSNTNTATATEEKEKSNFEKHLLSFRDECQNTIERN